MPTYSGSGTEPLGSNPSPKTSAPAAQDTQGGKPAGGTANLRAYEATLAAAQWKSGGKGASATPEKVQSFKDRV